ncbi:hypothetical protein ACLEPN_15400 [Myxococcus sp. 1LA]
MPASVSREKVPSKRNTPASLICAKSGTDASHVVRAASSRASKRNEPSTWSPGYTGSE